MQSTISQPVRRRRGEILCAKRSRRRAALETTERLLTAGRRISNVVSKKIGVLEIDLEIIKALPDKADKRKNVLVSNSPEFFASSGKTRSRIAFRRPIRPMLCYLLVFLLVSMDRTLGQRPYSRKI